MQQWLQLMHSIPSHHSLGFQISTFVQEILSVPISSLHLYDLDCDYSNSTLHHPNMNTKYQPLHGDEKQAWDDTHEQSIATEELGIHSNDRSSLRSQLPINCLWVVHAVLLFFSSAMLLSALSIRSSTLNHVRTFSAWCRCN